MLTSAIIKPGSNPGKNKKQSALKSSLVSTEFDTMDFFLALINNMPETSHAVFDGKIFLL